jgi:hypothetical protein
MADDRYLCLTVDGWCWLERDRQGRAGQGRAGKAPVGSAPAKLVAHLHAHTYTHSWYKRVSSSAALAASFKLEREPGTVIPDSIMAPKPAGGGGAGAGGKDAQPAWIRLLPTFHCALIAVAVVLAAFRFFVLGECRGAESRTSS